jgi:hypothetical protein
MGKTGRPRKRDEFHDMVVMFLYLAPQLGLTFEEFKAIAAKDATEESVREIINRHNREFIDLICDMINNADKYKCLASIDTIEEKKEN